MTWEVFDNDIDSYWNMHIGEYQFYSLILLSSPPPDKSLTWESRRRRVIILSPLCVCECHRKWCGCCPSVLLLQIQMFQPGHTAVSPGNEPRPPCKLPRLCFWGGTPTRRRFICCDENMTHVPVPSTASRPPGEETQNWDVAWPPPPPPGLHLGRVDGVRTRRMELFRGIGI